MIGFGDMTNSFRVYTPGDTDPVADMENEGSFYPIIGLRTDIEYFTNNDTSYTRAGFNIKRTLNEERKSNNGNHDGFGYFFQTAVRYFNIDNQITTINGEEKYVDYGTSVSGITVYVTPILFYSNRNMRIGAGVGANYMYASGDYIVTKESHDNYNQKQSIHVNGFDMSITVLLEFSAPPINNTKLTVGLIISSVAGGGDGYDYNEGEAGFYAAIFF